MSSGDEVGYRVDELAREAGTTVRNVRAYQDRGLLPPPRRLGRVGLYSDAHLARLRLIGDLLERGYSLANIGELLRTWERGGDVGELLGLEEALTAPWSDEVAATIPLEELAGLFGDAEAETLDEAVRLGIVEPDGDGFRVASPRLLAAGVELVNAGVPLEAALAHARRLRRDIDGVARRFVELVTRYVFDPVGDSISADEAARLADVVRRLRPLAKVVVDVELSRAMERHIERELRERVTRMLDHARGDAAS